MREENNYKCVSLKLHEDDYILHMKGKRNKILFETAKGRIFKATVGDMQFDTCKEIVYM
jgi:hypothetical protein